MASRSIPPSLPNGNALAERGVLSIKRECLDRTVFFGTDSRPRVLAEYAIHDNAEWRYRGVGNRLIAPTVRGGHSIGRMRKTERLGGPLNVDSRAA